MSGRAIRLQVTNFKAFESFSVGFPETALIVGPNNAGKSTLLSALKAAASMLRLANAKAPEITAEDANVSLLGYRLTPERTGLVEENLRHEFHNVDTRLRLEFSGRTAVTAVWPASSQADGEWSDLDDEYEPEEEDVRPAFFYLTVPEQPQPRRPGEVRHSFPSVAAIPPLTPVEQSETVLSEKYLRETSETRLVSRHFRNHLLLMRDQVSSTHPNRYEEFLEFIEPWVPEFEFGSLRTRSVPGKGEEIDVFYREPPRRAEKEIAWAGDGMQVWLQLLLHIFRLGATDVIVLDEPDLFLHADLQRRLVRFLETTSAQTITASHSSEMIAEADRPTLLWVDKSRGSAVRAPKEEAIVEISNSLGSQFNLRLAKALRVKTVLFVEGDDMKILASLCKTIGAERLAVESGIAVVPINGFENWSHIEPFQWIVDKFLLTAVTTFVVLDRDYRPQSVVDETLGRLKDIGVIPHVWARKELESYLLHPPAIARISGASAEDASEMLEDAFTHFKGAVFARALEAKRVAEIGARNHGVSVTERFQKEFDRHWNDPDFRRSVAPPKEVMHELNRKLQAAGLKPISARRLASEIECDELDDEAIDLLREIEGTL